MYIIYDEFHAEFISEKFDSFASALLELQKISNTPFSQEPNRPPCAGWLKCKREYHIVEYDDSQTPWELLSDTDAVHISASTIDWYIQ